MYVIGIDLVEIRRIEKAIENPHFLARVFGAQELSQFGENPPPQTIAGAFAAKEAFSKALGTGIRGFKLCEVMVLHDSLGAPYLQLTGNAQKIADEMGISGFSLSITHTEKDAMAAVIAEKSAADKTV